ncbi:MAG: hypothetical protein ACI4RO_02240 [Candidatus Scatosoma sp.]
MKKSVKTFLLATLCLSSVGTLSVAAMNLGGVATEMKYAMAAAEENESEQTPTADVVVVGAGVYVGNDQAEGGVDKNGIRFQILAKKTVVESAEIHALLLPADMTTDAELKADSTVIQNEAVEGTEMVSNEIFGFG